MNPATERALRPRDPAAGARNLLVDCIGLKAGERLLIVAEPVDAGHYDPALAPYLAGEARALGAEVSIREALPGAGPEDVPADLMRDIHGATHTLFLNRIGDQLRFRALPGEGSKSISYTLDLDYLGSAFATARHSAMEELHRRMVRVVAGSRRYSIRCPRGTDAQMECGDLLARLESAGGFTVGNFPVMIVPPIPAAGLNGRLVFTHVLTSTGIHDYADSVLPLASAVDVFVTRGEIARLDGDPALVARMNAQMKRVDDLFGGEGRRIGSWHAGINPFTFFLRPALADLARWSGVSFGSPRYTHFHFCGESPGDICGQIFDATIAFDDTLLWERGRLALLDAPEHADLRAALIATGSSPVPDLPLGI